MASILLIPGLLCDETVWQPLLETLGGNAVVADLSTQDSLTQMAEVCLRDNPGQLQVAGHSMGARVAMEMARIAPERIERLALLDTGIHPLKPGEVETRARVVALAYDQGMAALAATWLPPMIHAPNRENQALMQTLTDMVLRKSPELHERQITALLNRPDASTYIAGIACPTLLVVGKHDAWSPVAQHEDMRALLPDARLEVVADAGHFTPVEQPETVVRLLAAYLSES
jgi:pimeloyl-ACP methyl ester carboxylesterase